MLHNIEPHTFNNAFVENASEHENDYILCYKDNTILLIQKDNEYVIPRRKDFDEEFPSDATHYLFSLDEVSCFLLKEYQGNNPGFVFQEHIDGFMNTHFRLQSDQTFGHNVTNSR